MSEPNDLIELTDDAVLSPARLAEWVLVLQAKRIPYRVEHGRLWVARAREAEARAELWGLAQTPEPAPSFVSREIPISWNAVLGVVVLLLGIHVVAQSWGQTWLYQAGVADNRQLGQFWRMTTALFLHADGPHLAGNLISGIWFIVWLNRMVGNGTGWAMALLAGTIGNVLNALLHADQHLSIGASTAVFGMIGAISGLGIRKDETSWMRRVGIPLTIGLLLLALMGFGESRQTDWMAHVMGWLSGVVLAIVYWRWTIFKPASKWLSDRLWGSFAWIWVLYCWTMVLLMLPG